MEGRVARRRAEAKERIFVVAMRLFAERGFDGVTVADIAAAADIGKGTFFTHFPGKSEVFSQVGEQVSAAMVTAADDTADAPAADRLRSCFAAAAAWCERDPTPIVQMVRSRSFNVSLDAGSASQARVLAIFSALVTQGVRDGEFRAAGVEDAVTLLLAAYLAGVMSWGLDVTGRSLHERLDAALDLILNGLRS